MSRSKKRVNAKLNPDRDIRKVKQRGFRRHVKLAIKDGQYEELPDTPRKIQPIDPVE